MKNCLVFVMLMFCVSCVAPAPEPSEIDIVQCEIVDDYAPVLELKIELDENRWRNKSVRLKEGEKYKHILLSEVYGQAVAVGTPDAPGAGPLLEVAKFKNLENGKTFLIPCSQKQPRHFWRRSQVSKVAIEWVKCQAANGVLPEPVLNLLVSTGRQ